MYSAMKKLIQKKYYQTAAEAQDKIDVFYAMNRLTTLQYEELTSLIIVVYREAAE